MDKGKLRKGREGDQYNINLFQNPPLLFSHLTMEANQSMQKSNRRNMWNTLMAPLSVVAKKMGNIKPQSNYISSMIMCALMREKFNANIPSRNSNSCGRGSRSGGRRSESKILDFSKTAPGLIDTSDSNVKNLIEEGLTELNLFAVKLKATSIFEVFDLLEMDKSSQIAASALLSSNLSYGLTDSDKLHIIETNSDIDSDRISVLTQFNPLKLYETTRDDEENNGKMSFEKLEGEEEKGRFCAIWYKRLIEILERDNKNSFLQQHNQNKVGWTQKMIKTGVGKGITSMSFKKRKGFIIVPANNAMRTVPLHISMRRIGIFV